MAKRRRKSKFGAETEKTFALKVIETLDGLQLLRDAAEAVKNGKLYQLAVLSGQMRSLLIDKSGGAERRLLYIAEKLDVPLTMYCMRGVDDPSFPLSPKPKFWVASPLITGERQFEGQRELTFDQVLLEPFVLYDDVEYSAKTIIEWFANKAGGSHYSGSMPSQFAEMLTLKLGNIDPLRQILLQLAEATLVAGRKLLRAAVQHELHLLLAVPSRPKSDVFLIDAAYPGSPMRMSILLDGRGTPVVRLVGIDGSWINLVGNRLVTWENVRHLHVSVSVDDDLYTRADLHLDGESLGAVILRGPLFLVPEWEDYEVFHNKSVDGELQDFSFGLCELLLFKGNLSPYDRANMLLYEERKRRDPELKLALYEPKSFARSPPGDRNLKMEGSVKHVNAAEVLPTSARSY